MSVRDEVDEVVETALGRAHRDDAVLAVSGGPAGNARLTAWLGLGLLVLSLVELVTLLDIRGLLTWHLVVGLVLIPPSVAKTLSTGWRMLRYYAGSPVYRQAGPPPLLLRLLGPLVVFGSLAVLGTGIWLLVVGAASGRGPLFTVVGQQVSPLTVHQAAFFVWGAATGLHVLARLVPAFRLLVDAGDPGAPGVRGVPGGALRAGAVVATALLAVLLTVAVLDSTSSSSWRQGDFSQDEGLGHSALR